jgi:hypothetical protein
LAKNKQSSAWKQVEYRAAELFGGKRVGRGSDFGASRPDVECAHTWNLECKSRSALAIWGWYKKMQKDCEKFWPGENRINVLITKEKGKHGLLFTLSDEDFFRILDPKLKKKIAEMKEEESES